MTQTLKAQCKLQNEGNFRDKHDRSNTVLTWEIMRKQSEIIALKRAYNKIALVRNKFDMKLAN